MPSEKVKRPRRKHRNRKRKSKSWKKSRRKLLRRKGTNPRRRISLAKRIPKKERNAPNPITNPTTIPRKIRLARTTTSVAKVAIVGDGIAGAAIGIAKTRVPSVLLWIRMRLLPKRGKSIRVSWRKRVFRSSILAAPVMLLVAAWSWLPSSAKSGTGIWSASFCCQPLRLARNGSSLLDT